jgi:hypothetical protein
VSGKPRWDKIMPWYCNVFKILAVRLLLNCIMKHLLIFSIILLPVSSIISCSKSSNRQSITNLNDSNYSILHTWNIVYDSTYSGIGLGNHLVLYTGKAGDYFDFNSNGNLYIGEGPNRSTLSYTIINNTTLIISTFGITINGIPDSTYLTGLDDHHATLLAPFFATPGGIFGRKVQLIR